MDLLSHFLSSLTINATSIATWRFFRPSGVSIEDFSPGFLLSHIGGEPLRIRTAEDTYRLEQGDLFLAPLGGNCEVGFSNTKIFTPINQLPWNGSGTAPFNISAHYPAPMSVTLGRGVNSTQLLGIAFSLEYSRVININTSLPPFIHINRKQNPLHQVINPAIEVLVSDDKPGFSGMANRIAEFAIIASIRAYVLSKPEFPVGVFKGMADARLNRALQVIHHQFQQCWTVGQLAALSAMSRSNFSAKFNQLIGQTPIDYLNGVRINAAKHLLTETNLPLSQIAEQVGFNSDRVFRRVFSNTLHTTPRNYRNQTR